MDGRVDGRTSGRTDEWLVEWTGEWMDGRTGRVDGGGVNGRQEEWMDGEWNDRRRTSEWTADEWY